MEEPAIDECFRLLKLRRGADFSAVKQAYRANLHKCHPDRFQGRADLLPLAERKTKRLVQVYGVMERWYQEHGGIDAVAPSGAAGTGPGPFGAPDEPWDADGVPPLPRRFGLVLAAAVVAAVLAAMAWMFGSKPGQAAPPVKASGPAVAATPDVTHPPAPFAQPAPPDETKAKLAAMKAERDRDKSAWVLAYVRDGEAMQRAAEGELADARVEYDRDVRDRASEIKGAQDEAARQVERAARDSRMAQEAFARQEQGRQGALKVDYDTWLLARGTEAVAIIKALRQRENSAGGVFSDTEDPGKIFEFWTAEEAGGPEINIAAKTGVAVRQPDARFFPHFRSNIFLFDPEGQALVRMMESIVERHGALVQELGDRGLAEESELRNWDARHPAAPVRLSDAQESVMAGRARAIERLSRARARLEDARAALGPSKASDAFDKSPEGKKWSDRILALQRSLG